MVILRMSSVHCGYLIFTKNVFFDEFLTNSGGFFHYYRRFFVFFRPLCINLSMAIKLAWNFRFFDTLESRLGRKLEDLETFFNFKVGSFIIKVSYLITTVIMTKSAVTWPILILEWKFEMFWVPLEISHQFSYLEPIKTQWSENAVFWQKNDNKCENPSKTRQKTRFL